MPRHTFNVLLYFLRHGNFQAGDLVVYFYLTYWRRKCVEDEKSFFITKEKLRDLTNLKDSPGRLGKLYSNFKFSGGNHLFEYGGYHKLTFTDWSTCADPDEDENSRSHAEGFNQEIKERARQIREGNSAEGRKNA